MKQRLWKIVLQKGGQSLKESLFPGKRGCRICGCFFPENKLDSGLCPFCLEAWLALRRAGRPCPRCGSFFWPLGCQGPCSQGFEGFSGVVTAVPYRGVYRDLLLEFKYNSRPELAESLGLLLAWAWEESTKASKDAGLPNTFPFLSSKLKSPWLVPVPLHRDKFLRRGYNQSLLLAKEAGKRLGFDVKELLYRTRAGKAQAALDQKERKAALQGLFQRIPGYLPDPSRPLILIDDVITTGATLDACRQALDPQKVLCIKALAFAAGSGPEVEKYL